ncbi:hypothetical protein D9M72_459720 [compost metagenome]
MNSLLPPEQAFLGHRAGNRKTPAANRRDAAHLRSDCRKGLLIKSLLRLCLPPSSQARAACLTMPSCHRENPGRNPEGETDVQCRPPGQCTHHASRHARSARPRADLPKPDGRSQPAGALSGGHPRLADRLLHPCRLRGVRQRHPRAARHLDRRLPHRRRSSTVLDLFRDDFREAAGTQGKDRRERDHQGSHP